MNILSDMKLFSKVLYINLFLLISQKIICCEYNRPIIGVLSEEYEDSDHSYIASSYVKYLESAGARVVPIFINQNPEYYSKIVNQTNGLLFPGGSHHLKTSGYGRAGKVLWDLAINVNKNGTHYPIWGTSLGFQLLTVLANDNNTLWLTDCDSEDVAMSLEFNENATKSKLFGGADQSILNIFKTENVTINYHMKCITPENFTESKLDQFFNILTTNRDAVNHELTFVSTIEAKEYPIYGVQWHPEKNSFEFVVNSKHERIPHFYNAIIAAQYMANFFVSECRKNTHRFENLLKESQALIYNYNPTYTGQKPDATFQQIYVFSSANPNLWCVSLFIHLITILTIHYLLLNL